MLYFTIFIVDDLHIIIICLRRLAKKDVTKCRYGSKININNVATNRIKE